MMRLQWSIRELLVFVWLAATASWCTKVGYEQYLQYRYPYRIYWTDAEGRHHVKQTDWPTWYADYRRSHPLHPPR
jgi:hypothetical protein